jgi:hypothetical protein
MKNFKLLIAVLLLAAAFTSEALVSAALAQTAPPPAAAEKPAASVKPSATTDEKVASRVVSIAEKAQKCLEIEDTNGRLNCYDAAVKPQPSRNAPQIKGIRDCRLVADPNERLNCFDGFAAQIPKFTH